MNIGSALCYTWGMSIQTRLLASSRAVGIVVPELDLGEGYKASKVSLKDRLVEKRSGFARYRWTAEWRDPRGEPLPELGYQEMVNVAHSCEEAVSSLNLGAGVISGKPVFFDAHITWKECPDRLRLELTSWRIPKHSSRTNWGLIRDEVASSMNEARAAVIVSLVLSREGQVRVPAEVTREATNALRNGYSWEEALTLASLRF